MNDMKCDLCGVDDAVQDALLCPSCREAIARLLTIRSREGVESAGSEQFEEVIVYPERTINTRKAGS
jgi:hypothetical protein